jgi:outer membrane autotransporter protein
VFLGPTARVSWQHEFGEISYALDSSLASGAGGLFTVQGPRLGRDSLLLSAGLSVQWNDRVTTYAYFHGEEFRENYNSQNVSAGMAIGF